VKRPLVLIFMGVAGSGKTPLATLFAKKPARFLSKALCKLHFGNCKSPLIIFFNSIQSHFF
jgi:hypothetical protein